MTDKPPKNIQPSSGNIFTELVVQLRLIWHLMGDRRVNFFLKLIPVASFAYLINPIDLPTPIDDFGVIGLAFYMFIELCPPGVVQEHRDRLRRVIPGEWHQPPDEPVEDAVDAEFIEIDAEDPTPSSPTGAE